MENERRQKTRYDVEKNYFFVKNNFKIKKRCLLKNMSITGACIETPISLNNEAEIYLVFPELKRISLKSSVVWKQNNEYGVSFLLETNEDLVNISYILNNLRISNL